MNHISGILLLVVSAILLLLSPVGVHIAVDRTISGDARLFFLFPVPVILGVWLAAAWVLIRVWFRWRSTQN